jgi:hypothetical protein
MKLEISVWAVLRANRLLAVPAASDDKRAHCARDARAERGGFGDPASPQVFTCRPQAQRWMPPPDEDKRAP